MKQPNVLKDKKGQQLNALLSLLMVGGIIIVVIIVAVAIGSDVLVSIADGSAGNRTEPSAVRNVTSEGQAGLGNITGQMGLIGTVIALSVVLLILVTLLFRQFSGNLR